MTLAEVAARARANVCRKVAVGTGSALREQTERKFQPTAFASVGLSTTTQHMSHLKRRAAVTPSACLRSDAFATFLGPFADFLTDSFIANRLFESILAALIDLY